MINPLRGVERKSMRIRELPKKISIILPVENSPVVFVLLNTDIAAATESS